MTDTSSKPGAFTILPLPTLGLLPVLAVGVMVAGEAQAQSVQDENKDLGTIQLQAGNTGYLATQSASGKSTAPLLNTPKSVTVITRKQIEDRGATTLTDVLRTVPGITLGAAEGGTALGDRPAVRGFDSTGDIFVDGLRSVARTSYESFNLESIEVTKGPDGTTAGRGSTGGAVGMFTKAPVEGDNFTDANLTLGTGAFKRATLDTNKSYGSLGLRLNLMAQGADDLNGRDGLTSERYGIAPSLSYKFDDGSKLTASLYYYVNHDLPDYGLTMSTANTPAALRVGTGTKSDPYMPVKGQPNSLFYGLHDKDFRDLESKSVQLKYERQVGIFDWSTTVRLSEDSNYYVSTKGRSLATNLTQATRQSTTGNKQTNVLALNSQLSGNVTAFGFEHQLAFGVDFSHEKSKSGTVVAGASNDPIPASDYLHADPSTPWTGSFTKGPWTSWGDTDAVGVYAIDTIKFDPQWELNLGVRFDDYKVTYKTTTAADVINDSSFWNGSAGLVYKPTENATIYAKVGTSANPSSDTAGIDSSNNPTLATADLDPERSYNYEVGAKWQNDAGTLMLTGALFKTDKTNTRVTDALGNTALIGNTVVKGVELGIAGQVTEKLSVSGGFTYLDAEYRNAGFSSGVPSANNGNKVAGVIPRSFSLWGNYDVNDQLSLGAGATYLSQRYANAGNTAAVPSSVQIDVMASYKVTEATSLRLNVTNLFDDTIYGSAHVNGSEHVNVGPARTVALTLSHSF